MSPSVSPSAPLPKVRDQLVVVEIDGESVVLDRSNGRLHHLNGPANAIFLSCDGRMSEAELVHDLAEVFGGPTDRIADDVGAMIGELRASGLLERDGCADCGHDAQDGTA